MFAINSTNQKLHTKKGPKVKNTMMELSAPDFNEKHFCYGFSIPTGNGNASYYLLNEIAADKKKGSR